MKNLNQLLFIATIMVMCSCSEYVIIPQYVSVEKLNSLSSGMSKEEVSNSLSVQPYEAYHSTENGCELYGYKYLHRFQEINPKNKHERGALRNNVLRYQDESDAFLYFENGKLKDLIVADAKVDHEFVGEMIAACMVLSVGVLTLMHLIIILMQLLVMDHVNSVHVTIIRILTTNQIKIVKNSVYL